MGVDGEMVALACVYLPMCTLVMWCIVWWLRKHRDGIFLAILYTDKTHIPEDVAKHMTWTWWVFANPTDQMRMASFFEKMRARHNFYAGKTSSLWTAYKEASLLPEKERIKRYGKGNEGVVWTIVQVAVVGLTSGWQTLKWLCGEAVLHEGEHTVVMFCSLGFMGFLVATFAHFAVDAFLNGMMTPKTISHWILYHVYYTIRNVHFYFMAVPIMYAIKGVWLYLTNGYALSGPVVIIVIQTFLTIQWCGYELLFDYDPKEHSAERIDAWVRWRSRVMLGGQWASVWNTTTWMQWDWWEKWMCPPEEVVGEDALTGFEDDAMGATGDESLLTRRNIPELASVPSADPAKLSKTKRRAAAKERERVQEREQAQMARRIRAVRKEQQKSRAAIAERAGLRRRMDKLDAEKETLLLRIEENAARLEENAAHREELLDAAFEDPPPEDGGSPNRKSNRGTHAQHVDEADLRAQTLRNREEAEQKRRIREQREKEKAAEEEWKPSESGPSHKEGAPAWVEEPLGDGDKAKLQAEKVASLLRKQQQQRERVKEKEAQEKRESERLQSLKTGKRILQGNRGGDRASQAVRSSLQPLREDEPEPTLTLADVALGFQEDPRFQKDDDDAVSVATTAVPVMLTKHAGERTEERRYTEHQIKRTKKHGRVEPGNKPGTYVHHPCREGDPKLVTNSEGTVLTVI